MITTTNIPYARWLASWLCVATASLAGAASLSVSPSSTSNTYAGVITLQIGGLTNTEPVVVQEFLDANGNSTVDTGELLVDTFPISDGGVSTIGGQTNLNVPFDSNATGSAITTTLFFSAPLIVENFVGQHIFRVTSPSARFTPVDATFIVTNAVFSQSVTGQVFLGASPATNAVVVALTGQNGGVAGAALADSAGHYSLRLPANSYMLIASQPNCYFDTASAPQITLTNGMTATNNLYLTNGTVTLSGSVRDATNNSGLGGVFILLQSGDYLAIAFSASNGTFSASVAPASWQFEIQEDRMNRRGYVTPRQFPDADTTAGAVANVNLLLPKANAMFYGRLTNNLGAPFANVAFEADDGQNAPSLFKGNGFSDANGFYAVAVLAETSGWYCSPGTSDTPALANHILSQGQSVVLTSGQAYLLNFTALPATAQISGHVQDNAGNAVVGVSLNGGAFIGGVNYSPASALTDNSGNYSLAAIAGQWGVQFNFSNDSDALANHGLEDLFGPHQVNIPPTNAVLNITVYPTGSSVLSAPQRISPSQVSLGVYGSINTNYTLQVSTNLSSTNWSSLSSFPL
ncbi:MAG: carboxypeptidase regulatory-like domain-containing protein, partial [Verrucomicrobia bacterium]|nr:carboxypeptidase regulatory-like domain-containing protein [Verrucomicrobiota bacterium]